MSFPAVIPAVLVCSCHSTEEVQCKVVKCLHGLVCADLNLMIDNGIVPVRVSSYSPAENIGVDTST